LSVLTIVQRKQKGRHNDRHAFPPSSLCNPRQPHLTEGRLDDLLLQAQLSFVVGKQATRGHPITASRNKVKNAK
jgi:hypothetical protein